MPRPLRLELEGAVYHVTARAAGGGGICADNQDRLMLLTLLGEALEIFDGVGLAWCLMPDHYHFVLQTRRANLSRLMRHVNGVYTQRFNARHGADGSVFQGRFRAVLVQEGDALCRVCRHVDLNPVRSGLVDTPEEWVWSSYNGFIGRVALAPWHDAAPVYAQVAPGRPVVQARRAYAKYVSEGLDAYPWRSGDLRARIFFGDAAFARRMQARLVKSIGHKTGGRGKRPMQAFFREDERDAAIYSAFRQGGFTQTAIADFTGLSVSRISRILKSHAV